MTTSRGVNASRRMLSPSTSGYQEEIRDLQTTTAPPNFLRAVVVRVLTNPESLDVTSKNSVKQIVSNPDFLDKAPRNSLVVRVISGGQDRRGGTPVICYPFFSSHISLPVKTGEQVWILFEDPVAGGSLPYWISRPSEPSHVEDLNYCHSDRKFDRSSSSLTTSQKAAGGSPSKGPSFPNGGGTQSSLTLQGADDYETIFSEDPQSTEVTYEPVPRFTKRPGDVVIQGSNNSLIVLGEDRPGSSSKGDKDLAGSVDMVAGRGQTSSTGPDSVENTRGFFETDKNRVMSNQTQSLTEGDLDLVNDLSRVAVYMKTDGDKNLGLSGKFPDALKSPIDSIADSPYAIVKSTEVRIVSRENGSVRLIKEGPVGGNQSCLIMLPDGVVQLDGDLIYIGRGQGEASEPYIKFSKYKSQLTTMIDEVLGVFNSFTTNFAIPVAAPGTPHPGLTAAIPTVTTAITNLTTLKSSIDEAKSDRIFGE